MRDIESIISTNALAAHAAIIERVSKELSSLAAQIDNERKVFAQLDGEDAAKRRTATTDGVRAATIAVLSGMAKQPGVYGAVADEVAGVVSKFKNEWRELVQSGNVKAADEKEGAIHGVRLAARVVAKILANGNPSFDTGKFLRRCMTWSYLDEESDYVNRSVFVEGVTWTGD